MRLAASLLFMFTVAATGCAAANEETTDSLGADLVGGRQDARWSASGFLARGSSMDALDRSKPACGATLIAPNVAVTAAHCVTDASATFAFGTGNTHDGPVVRVVERHLHPDFHAQADGAIDLVHALRMHDVAYLVLEHAVAGVTPAELPSAAPASACNIQAIGYRRTDRGALRVSAPACVELHLNLATDPIFEVHPDGDSALCVADGDEGSAAVERRSDRTTLVGIYVGSVTQGLTDCRRGTQFLDGYESMYGYRDFLREGIERAATAK